MVKIDGAFVQNLTRSDDDRAFVRTLIDLGRAGSASRPSPNGCRTRKRAAMLRDWGCDYLQGALIGLALARAAMAGPAPGMPSHG